MSDENELDNTAGPFSFRSSPRSFDKPGGASSLSSSRCSWLLVRSSPCHVLLAHVSSRTCFPTACLLAIRSARFALSSYRSAPRSFDKCGGAMAVCVSVLVLFGRCCLFACRGGGVGVAWDGFPRWCCSSVDGVSLVSDGVVISVAPLLASSSLSSCVVMG